MEIVIFNINKILLVFLLSLIISCSKDQKTLTDNGEGITIGFLEGLNDNPTYQLSKDSNGFYILTLDRSKNQTIQRITSKLLRNGKPIEDLWSGSQPKKVNWESNLYWWLLEGDTVANITKTYLNLFTGELIYVNLPPLLNWRDVIVPTINESSYSDDETGIVNTVIAPIQEMIGDTMKIKMMYVHSITQKEEGSNYFNIIGERVFKDSIYVILK
ncbi:hypothetical protein OAD88_06695 [Flavobacteriaceae bacterium]|nr:hypothetical protein [Flavobacteriaceae bacterium]MDB9989033.1 hypothetical protein [Flavobacteriaceae bacterium]